MKKIQKMKSESSKTLIFFSYQRCSMQKSSSFLGYNMREMHCSVGRKNVMKSGQKVIKICVIHSIYQQQKMSNRFEHCTHFFSSHVDLLMNFCLSRQATCMSWVTVTFLNQRNLFWWLSMFLFWLPDLPVLRAHTLYVYSRFFYLLCYMCIMYMLYQLCI